MILGAWFTITMINLLLFAINSVVSKNRNTDVNKTMNEINDFIENSKEENKEFLTNFFEYTMNNPVNVIILLSICPFIHIINAYCLIKCILGID